MQELIGMFAQAGEKYLDIYIALMRYIAPALAAFLLLRCASPLLTFRREPEIWAWLCLEGGKKLPITHWENVIGRSKRSDIVIDFPTVSRTHCVLTRYDDGSWSIADAGSSSGVRVNGKAVELRPVEEGDTIDIGGIKMELQPISRRQGQRLAQLRKRSFRPLNSIANLLLLTVFQVLVSIGYLLVTPEGQGVLLGFGGIVLAQWALLLFYFLIRRTAFEVETLAFFLSTLGMMVVIAVRPGEEIKQLIALCLGLGAFLLIGWSLRDLERAKRFRYLAAVAGIGFLVITLLFGKEEHGAKAWIVIGNTSIQLSEISKLCFVYTGASAMERLVNRRNILGFIAYSVAVCGCLALMNDFGTALIFFCAFLIIAFLRSGSVGTVALACTSLGFAGVVALRIAPHALRRFSAWRLIWENPLSTGYQQTRSLMCIASGGLFGLGVGQGWMKRVFAADSDVVFATLAEEWGLLMAVIPVLCILVLAVFVMRSAVMGRSSFYTIGACTAAGIMMIQASLNVLGTVDLLPLTGVTFPFLSNGGSSMICAWGLLAFIKAADTRQNASFAVRISKERGGEDE